MLRIGLIGCGRIGRMHAGLIAGNPESVLAAVYDPQAEAGEAVAKAFGATATASVDQIMDDPGIDAVFVASVTATHADLIEAAVAAGKPVFCEKPIDLDLTRVMACSEAVEGKGVPIQIGFNRRFDPGNVALRNSIAEGKIGNLLQVLITSRDPEPPSDAYVAQCGGMLRDMTIHDFDLARFFLGGDEPVEVFARAGALIDPTLEARHKDVDCAMVVMTTKAGRQVFITNARQASYGYDQRAEALGDGGMLQTANHTIHGLARFDASGTAIGAPYEHFFIERYEKAFRAQLESFIGAASGRFPVRVGLSDGVRALVLAEAAYRSLAEGTSVRVGQVDLN